MNITQERGLSVVRSSILEVDDQTILAVGPNVPSVLGDQGVDWIAGFVAEKLAEHPDKTLSVGRDEVADRVLRGATGVILRKHKGRRQRPELLAFGGMIDFDHKEPIQLNEGIEVDLTDPIEIGSILGNGKALDQSGESSGRPKLTGQGARVHGALVHLASAEFDGRPRISVVNESNQGGLVTARKAGGIEIGTMVNPRLEHPKPEPGEPAPTGPVIAKVFAMNPRGQMRVRRAS